MASTSAWVPSVPRPSAWIEWKSCETSALPGSGRCDISSGIQHEAEVLLHQVHHEAGRVIAVDGARREVREHPRSGRSGSDNFEHLRGVDAGLASEVDGFGCCEQVQPARHLVAELYDLASAARADVDDGLPHRLEHRKAAFEHRCVAADHDGERARLRADIATRDGGVEHRDLPFAEFASAPCAPFRARSSSNRCRPSRASRRG